MVASVRGWGANYESWLIEHGELWGDTAFDFVWGTLAELLQKSWGDWRIARMFVDSGFKPESTRGSDNQIYDFCRRFRAVAFPTKGHDRQDKPLKASMIDVSHRGRTIKNGVQLWHLDSDYFKSWVHSRVRWPAGESGAWHLHRDTTDDYCQQVVAEQRLLMATGRITWIKTAVDNHYLDCEALNAAAAHSLSIHTLRPIQVKKECEKEEPQQEAKPNPPPQRKPIVPRRPGNFVNRFNR